MTLRAGRGIGASIFTAESGRPAPAGLIVDLIASSSPDDGAEVGDGTSQHVLERPEGLAVGADERGLASGRRA